MSDKKPRRRPKPAKKIVKEDFRICDAQGCRNAVSMEGRAQGYSGPVYCVLHSHMEKN